MWLGEEFSELCLDQAHPVAPEEEYEALELQFSREDMVRNEGLAVSVEDDFPSHSCYVFPFRQRRELLADGGDGVVLSQHDGGRGVDVSQQHSRNLGLVVIGFEVVEYFRAS